MKLRGEFAALGVQVLATPGGAIVGTGDRKMFALAVERIGEPCAQSSTAMTTDEAVLVAKNNYIGYPAILRAAYVLGGLGSGFAQDEAQLQALFNKAFAL